MAVEIGDIWMENPVMPASGCFAYGEEYSQFIDLNELGAIVTKSTTLEPRQGNPQPRIIETPCGMINFIGLQNPGIEIVIQEKIPFLKQFTPPIIVSIAGNTIEQYVRITEKLDKVEGVSGLEVNVSCPNTERGMVFGVNPELTFDLIEQIRAVSSLTLIVKLTPNVTDIVPIAKKAVEAGADALSLINTVKAAAFVPDLKDKNIKHFLRGGVSGSCIKPLALDSVYQVVQADFGVPIIGIGGIMETQDALEFLYCGATAVAVGTANFRNPMVMPEIIEGIRKFMVEESIADIYDIIGSSKKG